MREREEKRAQGQEKRECVMTERRRRIPARSIHTHAHE